MGIMGPTPLNDTAYDRSGHKKELERSWTTATIAVGAVFLFLLVAFIGTTIAFYIQKRKLRNEIPKEHRPRPYLPFRVASSDKSSLLAEIQLPDDERSSMFSHERASVALYLDAEPINKRVSSQSIKAVSLVPMCIIPVQRQDSLTGEISGGSGVSETSSSYSRGSITLSPVQQEQTNLETTSYRPRRTSVSSARYYGRNTSTSKPPDNVTAPRLPPVRKIICAESDQLQRSALKSVGGSIFIDLKN